MKDQDLKVCDVVEPKVVVGDDGRLRAVALKSHHDLTPTRVDVLFEVSTLVLDAETTELFCVKGVTGLPYNFSIW